MLEKWEIHFKNDIIYGLIRYLSVDRVVIVCNKKKKEKKMQKKKCVFVQDVIVRMSYLE